MEIYFNIWKNEKNAYVCSKNEYKWRQVNIIINCVTKKRVAKSEKEPITKCYKMHKFKEIIYKTLPYLPEILIVSLCIVSLCASFTALNKAQRNERGIVALQEDVSKLVQSQIHLQEELARNIEAIDAHISIIEKYAAANYNFFYGDGVKQKIKGDPQIVEVDPNGVLKHKTNKNSKK